ncbi:MAG TPA: hypothetical protein VEK07_21755 [Polyangiaceae bacterium]|nr:hypothetical protein [Polyangiaceae bacterium]
MERIHSPTFMDPAKAGDAIRTRVDARAPLTVADAATKTGLPLRDAENGLNWLSKEYRGQLRVTNEGQIVHRFPYGFSKPWERAAARQRVVATIGRGLLATVRFVVRAWVAIVLVGYAALFVALILALTFARQNNDSRRSNDGLPGGAMAYALLRVVGDALFWTFHPWSPFSVVSAYPAYGPAYGARFDYGRPPARRAAGPRVPLYERVNRFFFGPHPAPSDPLEDERRIVAAIRAGKGRIGLADVMRVTGLPREQADPLMAKLMLDYDGDVAVSDDGGLVYRFPEVRKTASDAREVEPSPAWSRIKPVAPLTGNSLGANVAIAGLNAFNFFMGLWAIQNGLTLERVSHLFDRVPYPIVADGTPIVLGIIPIVFSALLFVLPVVRALARPARLRKAAEEKARLAVLRVVLDRVRAKEPINDRSVVEAWRTASGRAPPPKRIDRELVALGGDVEIQSDGQTRWRFPDLETEAAAVAAEREAAGDDEARLGRVVFATDER